MGRRPTEPLRKKWKEWNETLESYTIPRYLASYHQPIQEITLHGFGDASSNGVCAVVYAVVKQEDGVTQGLVCSKSRIAKRNLTIPRLELISGHKPFMGASVAKWLAHLPFTSEAALGSSLSENFLNATRTQSSCEKSKSQRSAESRGFPPGTPVSSHRES